MLGLIYYSNCPGISISVPETIPASTAVYTVLARDPDPGETLEVSAQCNLFLIDGVVQLVTRHLFFISPPEESYR